jgi:hypothetical protein
VDRSGHYRSAPFRPRVTLRPACGARHAPDIARYRRTLRCEERRSNAIGGVIILDVAHAVSGESFELVCAMVALQFLSDRFLKSRFRLTRSCRALTWPRHGAIAS